MTDKLGPKEDKSIQIRPLELDMKKGMESSYAPPKIERPIKQVDKPKK